MTIPYRGTSPPIDDELLSAYVDGQVSPDERAAVEAAIAADPAVRERLTDLRATVALLRALPQPVPRRTFILTPEQAASIRPVRVPWLTRLTRLVPAVAAVGAVAAVLCLALIGGDLATGGFATKQQQTKLTRPAVESVSDATVTQVATGTAAIAPAPAATTASLPSAPTSVPAAAAAAATIAPAPAGTIASARSAAPAQAAAPVSPTTAAAGAILLPTGTPAFAPAGSSASSAASQAIPPTAPLPAPPTAVANVQPPPPASGGTVVTTETHRVPVALVRAGEVLLALLAIAGVTLAVLARRKVAAP